MAIKKCWQEIRQSQLTVLILIFPLLFSCQSGKKSDSEITIIWEDQKAVGLKLPIHFASVSDFTEIETDLAIRVEDQHDINVLGGWNIEGDRLNFTPLVPFTSGITYELYDGEQLANTFKIVSPEAEPSELLAIYPSSDTVPENLLKMYLQFSRPMQEGQAVEHIKIIDACLGDTLKGTFLDLQPELWNEDNTVLTLWLDPGRIKRGLIPNRELGIPLMEGRDYLMIVDSSWRGGNGLPLQQASIKKFHVGSRDAKSPDPDNWRIEIPKSGTKSSFKVNFGQPLDAILAIEALQILDASGYLVAGEEIVLNKERAYGFDPSKKWEAGDYTLMVQTRLEDLAGNNINRLFDEDISKQQEIPKKSEQVILSFKIE